MITLPVPDTVRQWEKPGMLMAHELKFADFVAADGWYHFAKTTFSGKVPKDQHTHDFVEIFWVTDGQGIHHINGKDARLSEGDLVFILPEDRHGFATIPGRTWTIANLAFKRSVIDDLLEKVPGISWEELRMPVAISLEHRAELERQVVQLLNQRESRFSLERFLMNLIHLLLAPRATPGSRNYPDWLRRGLQELRKQAVLQVGLEAFVKACARSQEHVNRECRKHLGKTPTKLVNDARLNYAEMQLVCTDKSIKEICWECGFKSSAYFHKLFKNIYGHSPLLYRKAQQTIFRGA